MIFIHNSIKPEKITLLHSDNGYQTRGYDNNPISQYCTVKKKNVLVKEQYREVSGMSFTFYSCNDCDRPFNDGTRKSYACIRCEDCKIENRCICYNCIAAAGGKQKMWR